MPVQFEFETASRRGPTKPVGQRLHEIIGYLIALAALAVTANNVAIEVLTRGESFWDALLDPFGAGVAVFAIPALLSIRFRWVQVAMFMAVGLVTIFLHESTSLEPLIWMLIAALMAWHYGYLTSGSAVQIALVFGSLLVVWVMGITVALLEGLPQAFNKTIGGSIVVGVVWTVIINQVRLARSRALELSTAVSERTAELETALEAKSDLVRELHHQTKNNLQMVSAMLSFESESITVEATQTSLTNAAERVHALARIHDQLLTSTTIGRVDLQSFLLTFTDDAYVAAAGRQADLDSSVETDAVVTSEFALRLGLLLNEVLYSILHSLPQTKDQHPVSLTATEVDDILLVSAEAPSAAPDLEKNERVGIGFGIAESVINRANGDLAFSATDSISWEIRIPLDRWQPEQRVASSAEQHS